MYVDGNCRLLRVNELRDFLDDVASRQEDGLLPLVDARYPNESFLIALSPDGALVLIPTREALDQVSYRGPGDPN